MVNFGDAPRNHTDYKLGVSQSGQTTRPGTGRSLVRIQPSRPPINKFAMKLYDISEQAIAPPNSRKASSILNDAKRIMRNDENERGNHLGKKDLTEFWIQRRKKACLVSVGESWTFGEGLPGIASGQGRYDFANMVDYGFSGLMARSLGTDLYQFAVPGNCNRYIFDGLSRILKLLESRYKRIYVVVQMTHPSRDFSGMFPETDPRHDLLDPGEVRDKVKHIKKIEEWFALYDKCYMEELETYLTDNTVGVLWKNFNEFHHKGDFKFKVIDTPWITHSAKLHGVEVKLPLNLGVDFMTNDQAPKVFSQIEDYHAWIDNEIECIESTLNFIGGISDLNSNHPNAYGHYAWAQYLLIKSGWKEI